MVLIVRPNDEAAEGDCDDGGPVLAPVAGRYTVQSVARALRLVETVAEGPADGRSLSELARALGTSKSTTLALARTLVARSGTCGRPRTAAVTRWARR